MSRKKKIVIFLIIFVILLIICGGVFSYLYFLAPPQYLKNIAYDNKTKPNDYIVYLKEDGDYVPFIVTSKDYLGDGSNECLLVRKHVLSDTKPINLGSTSYYENSNMDLYLNDEYIKELECQDIIDDIQLEIASKKAIGNSETITTIIKRKVFILSAYECYELSGKDMLQEGNQLKYFKSIRHREVYNENGEMSSWWFRTPNCSLSNNTYYMETDGRVYSSSADESLSIMPSFCINGNTKITLADNIVEGKQVFVLNLD